MLLEKNIQEIVLEIITQQYNGMPLPKRKVRDSVMHKFRMNKKLINLTLTDLQKKGKIKVSPKGVVIQN